MGTKLFTRWRTAWDADSVVKQMYTYHVYKYKSEKLTQAMGYGLDDRSSNLGRGTSSGPALRPRELPIQGVGGSSVKLTTNLHLVPRLRIVELCLHWIRHRDTFNLPSFIHQWLYNPFLRPRILLQFHNRFKQLVGLLWRVIGPSQGRCLHRTTQTQKKHIQTSMP
jgi:hypothetical protein